MGGAFGRGYRAAETKAVARPGLVRGCVATRRANGVFMVPIIPRDGYGTRPLAGAGAVVAEALDDARHLGVVEDRGLAHLDRLPVQARHGLDLVR